MQGCCQFIGLALQHLLRRTVEGKLYGPGEVAYIHLKAAVSGGPSTGFQRYHEASVIRIRSHQYAVVKSCKRVLGMMLSTMLKDIACGKVKVIDYEDNEKAALCVRKTVLEGKLFEFVKCKLAAPKHM